MLEMVLTLLNEVRMYPLCDWIWLVPRFQYMFSSLIFFIILLYSNDEEHVLPLPHSKVFFHPVSLGLILVRKIHSAGRSLRQQAVLPTAHGHCRRRGCRRPASAFRGRDLLPDRWVLPAGALIGNSGNTLLRVFLRQACFWAHLNSLYYSTQYNRLWPSLSSSADCLWVPKRRPGKQFVIMPFSPGNASHFWPSAYIHFLLKWALQSSRGGNSWPSSYLCQKCPGHTADCLSHQWRLFVGPYL